MKRVVALMSTIALLVATASQADTPPGFVRKWGEFGTGDGQFDQPLGIAVDPAGNVYVTDGNNHRVQKFDAQGNFLLKWGSDGAGDGQFSRPIGIAVDPAGNVYVSDIGTTGSYPFQRIQKFTSSGVFITKWGSFGTGNGQFRKPYGLAVDDLGNVYVGENVGDRVQKFTGTGTYLLKWGAHGTGIGQFQGITTVAADATGNIYVPGGTNYNVQRFDASGIPLLAWGSPGSGDGQFNIEYAVAADDSGHVYVGETGNDRIQKFASDGTFLTKWGSTGSGDGQFRQIRGIAVDHNDNIYVVDTTNNRVQKFAVPTVVVPDGCLPPSVGMVAWWPLDETAPGPARELVGGLDGVQVKYPGFGPGMVNGAYGFFANGNANVSIPGGKPTLAMGTGDFSIDAWIKPENVGNSPIRPIFCNALPDVEVDGISGYMFYVNPSSPADNRLGLVMGSSNPGLGKFYYFSTGTVTPGIWQHVAVTVRRVGGSPLGTFYINGVPAGTFTPYGGDIDNGLSPAAYMPLIGHAFIGPTGIAATPCPAWPAFEGWIDEVRVFKRELTPTEVAATHGARSAGQCILACNLPSDVQFCPADNEVASAFTICNYGATAQSVTWGLSPLLSGQQPGCAVDGPTLFTPAASGAPLLVPADSCITVNFAVTRPAAGLPDYTAGCYRLSVMRDGITVATSVGSVWGAPAGDTFCIGRVSPPLQRAREDTLRFVALNTGSESAWLRYRLDAVPSNGLGPNGAVGLDGLEPGIAIVDSAYVPSQNALPISVVASFTGVDAFRTYDVVLSRDYGPSGPTIPVASGAVLFQPLRVPRFVDCNANSVDDSLDIATSQSLDTNGNGLPDECEQTVCSVTAVGINPPVTFRFLGAATNPSSGPVHLRFSGGACRRLSIEILDIGGRRVNAWTASGLGDSDTIWDGRNSRGEAVAAGLYLVRAVGDCGAAGGKILLVR